MDGHAGYVGVGFLPRAMDRMYPSDIVWGYATTSTGYINSFYASVSCLTVPVPVSVQCLMMPS